VLRIVRVLAPNPGLRELEGTNTWILGMSPSIVIDPGPEDEGHLNEVQRSAGPVAAVLLSHDHPDHASGAAAFAAMSGAPVYAARPLPGGDRLRDGQVVTANGVAVTAVATPGHTPDHFVFFVATERALFTGDAVLGRGTSVIDPPEGDLVRYLRSLDLMRDLAPRTIYPGHGPVVLEAVAKLDEYIEHRALREEQVLSALNDVARAPEEMVPDIYADYSPELHPLAARSMLAHLLKLEAEGRAEKSTKGGVTRFARSEPSVCARCGRPVKGRARLCGPCSLAVLQE
jgi:glyoxylase-like metal-dependent hydrolase (beta-lactamase superfamily II)